MSAKTTLGEEDVSADQFESRGLESDTKNVAPESSFTGVYLEVHNMMTGVSGKDYLGKKENAVNQTTNTKRLTTPKHRDAANSIGGSEVQTPTKNQFSTHIQNT